MTLPQLGLSSAPQLNKPHQLEVKCPAEGHHIEFCFSAQIFQLEWELKPVTFLFFNLLSLIDNLVMLKSVKK